MVKCMKRQASLCMALVIAASLFSSPTHAISAENPYVIPKKVKNVIVMIPDGMSVAGTTLARWYRGGEPLALDEMVSGLVRTYWAAGAISDSAPRGNCNGYGL